MKKKDKYAVYIKGTKGWDVMKLRYDPRTGKDGLAIYSKRDDATFCDQMAHALSGGSIETRVAVYQN